MDFHFFEMPSKRKSWCDENDPCRYCKDYRAGGTLRQACLLRPRNLKISRRKKGNEEDVLEPLKTIKLKSSPKRFSDDEDSPIILKPLTKYLNDKDLQDEACHVLLLLRKGLDYVNTNAFLSVH